MSLKYWPILIYPPVLILIALVINFFSGVTPLQIALPSGDIVSAAVISLVLLVINHSWLMTTTEIARHESQLFASPEEQQGVSSNHKIDISLEKEVKRRLNIHRNTTENIPYYLMGLMLILFVSPPVSLATCWVVLFPIARLGYTYAYLKGSDSIRGIFMSLGLLSVYGFATYLLLSLIQ